MLLLIIKYFFTGFYIYGYTNDFADAVCNVQHDLDIPSSVIETIVIPGYKNQNYFPVYS